MAKETYIELTREQSLYQTYLVCLKYNTLEVSDFRQRWDSRPLFEQRPIGDRYDQEETDPYTVRPVGEQEVQEKQDEKVLAV